jgi:hypothetical protein
MCGNINQTLTNKYGKDTELKFDKGEVCPVLLYLYENLVLRKAEKKKELKGLT